MDSKLSNSSATNITDNRILSPQMKEEVRRFLSKDLDYWNMEEHRKKLKCIWALPNKERLRNSYVLKPLGLHQCCNKTTTLYVMSSVHVISMTLPLACIFKEWFRNHNNRPNIDCDQFFATLRKIHPEKGPQSINGIVDLHNSICCQALAFLSHIRDGESQDEEIRDEEGRDEDGFTFIERKHGAWEKPENYVMNPIYTAIIMVMDQYMEPLSGDPFDVIVSEHSQRQSVLLVRTGQESGLSAPISFDELRANGNCLPLSETDVSDLDIVRVSLETAVKFIGELEQRENTVIAGISDEFTNSTKEYAEYELELAEKGGDMSIIDDAVERIVAADHREEVWSRRWEETQHPFNRHWK